jgi:hypothetical protein
MQNSIEMPRLVPRQCGGWLALAPRGASLRIGVWADSEGAAREKYQTAVREWRATLALGGVSPSPVVTITQSVIKEPA